MKMLVINADRAIWVPGRAGLIATRAAVTFILFYFIYINVSCTYCCYLFTLLFFITLYKTVIIVFDITLI